MHDVQNDKVYYFKAWNNNGTYVQQIEIILLVEFVISGFIEI